MIIKSKDTTSFDYGCIPKNRPIGEYIRKGVINLDKPSGPTSHEVVAWIKKILKIEKAGHVGTLDPGVSGVLPILLGDSTKASRALIGEKEYVCLMKLHKEVPEDSLRKIFNEFTGKIYQRPPLKSAVKRRIRIREIYEIKPIEIQGKDVLFRVRCEAGTYVRKLCHDIGEALGVGAHMEQLRRTKSVPFDESNLVTLQDVKDAFVFYEERGDETLLRMVVLPMEYALKHLPKIIIKDSAVDALCHGADLTLPGVVAFDEKISHGERVAVFTLKGEAVCMGLAIMSSEEMLEENRGICVDTKRVFMEKNTYPRRWHAGVAER
ncbi:MAG: RNA-guided pseudouridylation complex pseudouridine synthase subunit Cbf5 [Candidatus Syntropharchaeia archaeon]